ncbi:hypothetical protein M758_1G045300 [Ceratodon purpureus]|nr:hypothetical protein M758_1G045300 [Ceratodon purpureus]
MRPTDGGVVTYEPWGTQHTGIPSCIGNICSYCFAMSSYFKVNDSFKIQSPSSRNPILLFLKFSISPPTVGIQ